VSFLFYFIFFYVLGTFLTFNLLYFFLGTGFFNFEMGGFDGGKCFFLFSFSFMF